MSIDFSTKLAQAQKERSSVVCVGLDPDPERLPPHLLRTHDLPEAVLAFNTAIIESTASTAAAYKLNLAFYEVLEQHGWRVLAETLAGIPDSIVTIADGKRGDIGNSARFYAHATFEKLGFDGCTVSGYMGSDSVAPFLEYDGRAAFVLIRTSNAGADEVQETGGDGSPLFERMAAWTSAWAADHPGTLGFVMGATDTKALGVIRERYPDIPLLIPGIGAQGGDEHDVMSIAALGEGPVLINSSRSIIYASSGRDFADAAGQAAESLRSRLEALR